MEWPVILAIIVAVTLILFPAVFIWYLNVGGMYAALREKRGFRIPAGAIRTIRVALAIIVPVAIYAFAVWFCFGHFGWQVTVAVALVFPIVLLVPALIWAAVVSGLYQVALDRLRRRVPASRRKVGKLVEEPVESEDT